MSSLLQWFVLSDIGRVREVNEDSVRTYPIAEELKRNPKLVPPGGRLCVVADGMGGHRGGREASSLAVRRIGQLYYSQLRTNPEETIESVIQQISRELLEVGQSDPELERMGTTVVLATAEGTTAYVANVGDSRAYLLRDRQIHRLTIDDRWVDLQVREGLLSDEQARAHAYRNLLTQYLGSAEVLNVHQARVTLQPGDLLLLCSDGLHDLVNDQELSQILTQTSPEGAPKRLVNLALKRGAPDNATVAVGYYGPLRPRYMWLLTPLLLVGALLLVAFLLSAALSGLRLASSSPLPTVTPERFFATTSTPTRIATSSSTSTEVRPTSTSIPATSTPTPTPTPPIVIREVTSRDDDLTSEQQAIYDDCRKLESMGGNTNPRIILARTHSTELPVISFDFGDEYPQEIGEGFLVRTKADDKEKCVQIQEPLQKTIIIRDDHQELAKTTHPFEYNKIYLVLYQP